MVAVRISVESQTLDLCDQFMEKYPGEFEPYEHEFISGIKASPVPGRWYFVFNSILDKMEALWSAERGMLIY